MVMSRLLPARRGCATDICRWSPGSHQCYKTRGISAREMSDENLALSALVHAYEGVSNRSCTNAITF